MLHDVQFGQVANFAVQLKGAVSTAASKSHVQACERVKTGKNNNKSTVK